MLLPYTTLTYYGPTAAAFSLDDGIGVGSLHEATPHQEQRPSMSVIGTGTADILRPYRGYAAALSTYGESFMTAVPHKTIAVKMTVNVGAVPSAEDVAQAIWNSQASTYNYSGTMGNKLNTASSGGVDIEALAQAVWEYTTRTLTAGGGGSDVDDIWTDSRALTVAKFLGLK